MTAPASRRLTILDQVIGLDEAAEILGVHRRRVQQLVRDGRLPAKRVGRDWVTTRPLADACAAVERVPGRPPRTLARTAESTYGFTEVSAPHRR